MAHPLSSPSLSSLPVAEGDFPFVLSVPKTQFNLELEIPMKAAVSGVAVGKFISSLRDSNSSCGSGVPWNQV